MATPTLGHPVGCAAALAALEVTFNLKVDGLNLNENASRRGDYIRSELRSLANSVSTIGEVRGIGLMMCIDVVSDRDNKTPAGPEMMSIIAQTSFDSGRASANFRKQYYYVTTSDS